jgi:hypothetical protein
LVHVPASFRESRLVRGRARSPSRRVPGWALSAVDRPPRCAACPRAGAKASGHGSCDRVERSMSACPRPAVGPAS